MAATNSTRRHRRRGTGRPAPQGSNLECTISGTMGDFASPRPSGPCRSGKTAWCYWQRQRSRTWHTYITARGTTSCALSQWVLWPWERKGGWSWSWGRGERDVVLSWRASVGQTWRAVKLCPADRRPCSLERTYPLTILITFQILRRQ